MFRSDHLPRKTNGWLQGLVKNCRLLRMDTLGSLKRIAKVVAVVARFYFPVVSHQFTTHSDSNMR
jgi:hypothetical protein